MTPEVWGPHLWTSIHFIALGYPKVPTEEQRQLYKHFFTNLHHFIPCMKCAINYKRHLEEFPIDGFLDTKMKLFEWTVHVHNIVNRELGKTELTVPVAMVKYMSGDSIHLNSSREESSQSQCYTITNLSIIAILLILIILSIIFIVKRRIK